LNVVMTYFTVLVRYMFSNSISYFRMVPEMLFIFISYDN
jgi:hypothetical protein